VHLVCIDGSYNMVGIQQVAALRTRRRGAFGPVDVVKFAESMGARGLRIEGPDQVVPALRQAMDMPGPVIVGVPVDYRDNPGLMATLHEDVLH
jgi:acetolactate synthase I/II/III large subunit